jgi:nitrite reductase (NADH) small subunit
MTTSTKLADVDDIPLGEGRAYTHEDKQLAVFRLRDGSVRVLDAVCAHAGGPLADGLVDGAVVVCPLHNYTYDLETGREVSDSGLSVCAFAAKVADDGSVHVDL